MNLVTLNATEDEISPLADPLRETTVIGDLPKDWEVSAIGRSLPFVTSGSRGWARYYSDAGAPFIRIGNLSHDWVDVNLSDLQYVELDSTASAEATRTRLHRGDLLVSITADIGAIGFVHDQVPLPAYINQHIALVRFDPAAVHSKFAAYVLSSQPVQRIFKASMDVGAKAGMSLTTVCKILLPLPPVPEQEAIAEALSDVDGLIGALEKLIAKKRAIKQAAMQQLFSGKTRLPGFTGKWETKRLGDFTSIRNHKVLPSSVSPEMPCVELEHIGQSDGRLLARSTAKDSMSVKYSFQSGDVLFGRLRPYLRKFWLADYDGICTTEMWPLIVDPRQAVPDFLYVLVQTERFIDAASISYGTHMPRADWGVMRALEVRLPRVEEQQTIATVLSDMDTEVEALEYRREKTRQIKQGMMQQLLTGRIRLVKPGVVASEKAMAQSGARQANVHFVRSVLAAEIIDQLHEQPTFGHVKFEKLIYLAEHLCKVDTGSHYHRDVAGPYDNRALRSIDSQLRTQKWFDAQKVKGRYQYVPLEKRGGHRQYFDRYFSEVRESVDKVISAFKIAKTEQCEIVATLYSAWNDLIRQGTPASDQAIVDQVLNHWHESKKRIPEERWLKALEWMREKGFVPEGTLT